MTKGLLGVNRERKGKYPKRTGGYTGWRPMASQRRSAVGREARGSQTRSAGQRVSGQRLQHPVVWRLQGLEAGGGRPCADRLAPGR